MTWILFTIDENNVKGFINLSAGLSAVENNPQTATRNAYEIMC